MTGAAYLLLYAAAVTFLAPPLLWRLTRRGRNPRWGIAAWLTAVVGALAGWTSGIVMILAAGLSAFPDSSVLVLCLELLGFPESVARTGPLSWSIVVLAGVVVSAVVGVRVVGSILGLRRRSLEHARTARIVGLPTDRPDVFVLSADRPAAYCVVGRPDTIVVTTAAMATLDDTELSAVLAHEDAHIAGRHHHLLMVLRALARHLRYLPLFPRGADAVAELLEMCADDEAARRHGIRPLVAGMISLAGPAPGLAVAATAVAARVERLLDPADRATRWWHQVAITAVVIAIVTTPVVINVLCSHH